MCETQSKIQMDKLTVMSVCPLCLPGASTLSGNKADKEDKKNSGINQ